MFPAHFDLTWVIYGLRVVGASRVRYVGLTRQTVRERLRQHISPKTRGRNTRNKAWLNKHRHELEIVILEQCPVGDEEYLAYAERYWIMSLRSMGFDLNNLSDGGESGSRGARWTLSEDQIRRGESHPNFGRKLSDEAKLHLSRVKLGTKRSEESRRKQGDAIRGSNHWAYGVPKSEDHRKKISDSLTGHTVSGETRMKMSETRRGIRISEEHKAKISAATLGEKHHNFGKPAFNRGMPSISAHTRWHTNKGVSKPETCRYCAEDNV